jgi:hypothetical protein
MGVKRRLKISLKKSDINRGFKSSSNFDRKRYNLDVKVGLNTMAKAVSLKIIVLLCPTCGLPMPFEDYGDWGNYLGECAICESQFQARKKANTKNKYEIKQIEKKKISKLCS